MTGGDGHVPPPAPLHAGTGPIGGFSAESGGAGGGDVGGSTKPGNELALAGCSSADNVGSPPPLSESRKGREVEAEGGEKKRKKAVLDDPDVPCSKCPRLLDNLKALSGHVRMQVEEVARTLLNLGQTTLNKIVGSEAKGDGSAVAEGGAPSLVAVEARRKKIHMGLDLNKEPPEDDVRMPVEEVARTLLNLGQTTLNKIVGSEAKGDGSAVAEGGAPSLAVLEARRKKIHMGLDLNKEPPEDDKNDDEDYGGDDEGA